MKAMTIAEFQALMKTLYFEQDKKRGIHRTTLWLMEEMGEFAEQMKQSPEKIDLAAVKEEAADIVAWLCSICNILGISLQDALQEKYPNKCRRCEGSPCTCNFS